MQELMTVQEVAEYLRIKERKVYDLLAHKRIPCTRVTGKWLFPRFQIDRWLEQNSEIQQEGFAEKMPPRLLVGSHDPLLEWALRESDFPFAIQTTGSSEGLARFISEDAMVCGLHILDPETNEYNIPVVQKNLDRQPVVLIEWARRQQGILVAPGNPLAIKQISDLKTKKVKIIDRQAGAGSYILLETLLRREGISKEELTLLVQPARSELDIGAAVANGKADAGIAIEAVASQFKLDFIPLGYEFFDLVIHHRHYFDEPFQRLLSFTKQPQFLEKAEELDGYDVLRLGRVRYNCL
ncbi:MAG: substrate-binding domain-containing protein [Gammaproteobacteria bacterium]